MVCALQNRAICRGRARRTTRASATTTTTHACPETRPVDVKQTSAATSTSESRALPCLSLPPTSLSDSWRPVPLNNCKSAQDSLSIAVRPHHLLQVLALALGLTSWCTDAQNACALLSHDGISCSHVSGISYSQERCQPCLGGGKGQIMHHIMWHIPSQACLCIPVLHVHSCSGDTQPDLGVLWYRCQ